MAGKKSSSKKLHLPNTRLNKWFTEEDYNLEVELGREWLEGDLNIIVVLFRIDLNKTIVDDLYGEAKAHEKHYHPPVELRVKIDIDESTTSYDVLKVSSRESQPKLIFSIFTQQLEEKNTEVSRGDIIGYNDGVKGVRYFEVFDANYTNISNNRTIMGYKSYWRKISCIMIDKDVFDRI